MQPELLASSEIRPIADRWVRSARALLDGVAAGEQDDALLLRAALETNFAWARAVESERAWLLSFIAQHFASIEGVLGDAKAIFPCPTPEDLRRFFGASPPPAYAFDGHVYFTPEFRLFEAASAGGAARGFGPLCLTAMVIHESVHVFDPRSGAPEIHIAEWDEPKFSAIPPQLQIHNPSAYASFAGQVHHRKRAWPREARFGAGRRAD